MIGIIKDTDSSYFESKHWDELNKAGFFGKKSLQGETGYGDGGIFCWLLLAPKITYCLTIDKNGKTVEHKAFRGCTNVSEKLYRKKYSKILNGDEVIAKVPVSWKHSFDSGVLIPQKQRFCDDCENDSNCDNCDKLINQSKEISSNLIELKRQPPKECGQMLL